MQFGAQHPGGIGVPAVGMAFPGYVAQPNGLPNSEMTWYSLLIVNTYSSRKYSIRKPITNLLFCDDLEFKVVVQLC